MTIEKTIESLPRAILPGTDMAGQTLVGMGQNHSNLWVVTADVMHSTKTEPFFLTYPDRSINVGIAEQTMVGVAAGLATCGKIPYVAAFAAMLTMRSCEQIRTDVAYPNLNVKFISTHSGFALGPGGTTHQSTEDIAIMRSMANMTVLVPCDAEETREAVLAAYDHPGPVYIRLGRGRDPIVHSNITGFVIGKSIELCSGNDITLIGCGRTVAECLLSAKMLKTEGIDVQVLDMHTIKPIDVEGIKRAVEQTHMIFTVEEHNIIGGLGGAVAEVMAELGNSVPLVRIGLPDIYASIGPQDELLDKYNMTASKIFTKVMSTLKQRKLF